MGGAVVLTALLSLEALHLGRADAVQYPEIHPAYWWIVFILAVAGLLIAAFERPPRWPTTVPHLLNSVYFVVLPLVLFRLKRDYYDPSSDSPSALLESTLLGGTIAYAIAALGCGITVVRGARDELAVTGLVMTVFMTGRHGADRYQWVPQSQLPQRAWLRHPPRRRGFQPGDGRHPAATPAPATRLGRPLTRDTRPPRRPDPTWPRNDPDLAETPLQLLLRLRIAHRLPGQHHLLQWCHHDSRRSGQVCCHH